MMKLKVHLVFPGTCEVALDFYKETLQGEVDFIFRKGEDKSVPVSKEDEEKISHMVIKTPYIELGGEDANSDQQTIVGNNVKLVLVFYDLDECKRVFDSFSEKGIVTMPLQKTFFCDAMGELTDCYGISWIIMMTDENYQA